MTKPTLRQSIGLGVAILAGAGGVLSSGASIASATPPPVDITVVGSNTTQEVMGPIINHYNHSATAATLNAHVTNVFSQPLGRGTVAPSDSHCNGGTPITYIQGGSPGTNQRTAPNGSGAGKTALATSVTNGDSCVSVARSSSPGSASDPAGTQAFAFAVDGVTWTASPTGNAPANLSMTQLAGIYSCRFTNWSQVGGKPGRIVRYFPQSGSGSGSFFAGVLGFDPRVTGGVNTCGSPALQIEENEATQVAASDKRNAIMIFAGGNWAAQANHVDTDLRAGFVLKTINRHILPVTRDPITGKYGPSSIVTEANVEPATYAPTNNRRVQGVRNLFNFINTNSVDYAAASSFVGANSPLCTGKESATITRFGYQPLASCFEES